VSNTGDFMKYVEKLRTQKQFEESKGMNSQIVNPQKLLEEKIGCYLIF
jgi:hypothetical protein